MVDGKEIENGALRIENFGRETLYPIGYLSRSGGTGA